MKAVPVSIVFWTHPHPGHNIVIAQAMFLRFIIPDFSGGRMT